MLAFRDPVSFHLMAPICNTLSPSSLQKEKDDHGDRMPEAQVPQPQRDTCLFSSCFIDQSRSHCPTQMQGGLKESPWQAATSQHELHMMQGEHTSLSQPLVLTHTIAVKVKWANTHQCLAQSLVHSVSSINVNWSHPSENHRFISFFVNTSGVLWMQMTYLNTKLAIRMIYLYFGLCFINSFNSHLLSAYQDWAPAVNQTPYARHYMEWWREWTWTLCKQWT